MPRTKKGPNWERFREEIRGGAIHEHTCLNALAEQAEALATVQEDAAKHLRASNVDELGVPALRESAGTLRGIASNIHLHALTHINDEARPLKRGEADRLLAEMPK